MNRSDALDPFTSEQMQQHLLHLHRHYGVTMVLITHDMDEALALGHRDIVLRVSPGTVVGDVTPTCRQRPRQRRPLSRVGSVPFRNCSGCLNECDDTGERPHVQAGKIRIAPGHARQPEAGGEQPAFAPAAKPGPGRCALGKAAGGSPRGAGERADAGAAVPGFHSSISRSFEAAMFHRIAARLKNEVISQPA